MSVDVAIKTGGLVPCPNGESWQSAALFPNFYAALTPPGQSESEFLTRIQAALEGGVDTLQLRCKDWEAGPYIALAEKVRDLAYACNVPFFVNDRVDVALAAGADGLHLGRHDLPPRWAREIAPQLLLGRSTHTPVTPRAP